MTLTLQHRWEHALIATTIDTVSRKTENGFLGRTAIQKLLYFMKVLGVPMKYNFDIHYYGPFCPNISHDVEWLLADHVIADESLGNWQSKYKPGTGWPELYDQHKIKIESYRGSIDSVCNALKDFSTDTLELIATLDFSYRWIRARGGEGPWKETTIEKFKQIKKEKFDDAKISEWYDALAAARIIEN